MEGFVVPGQNVKIRHPHKAYREGVWLNAGGGGGGGGGQDQGVH